MTATAVREKSMSLARAGAPTEDAIRELLESSKDKRVPIVVARQELLKDLEERPSDPVLNRAAELLEGALDRMPSE